MTRNASLYRIATATALALSLMAGPLKAETQDTPPATQSDPIDDLVGRGLEAILNDMLSRAEPHLEGLAQEMQGMFDAYAPALNELSALVDDIGNYQTPERLENGDILIRRKAGAPPPPPLSELRKLAPDGAAPQQPPQIPLPPLPPLEPLEPQISI